LDMSEFMEPHSVSKLIGSPPGYVGYDDAGQLSEFVRRNPYSVVLFDEIEKAHLDIFNLLLQILDSGILTDTHGRKVDFSQTMIIMTSNIGAREMMKAGGLGFASHSGENEDRRRGKVMDELKRHFNPEFLNRVDEIITFRTLGQAEIRQIIEIMISQMNDQLFDRKLKLEFDTDALDWVAERGFDEKYGARPLRRTLQREVEDHLANRMLAGAFTAAHRILVSVKPSDPGGSAQLEFTETDWLEWEELQAQRRQSAQSEADESALDDVERTESLDSSTVSGDSNPPAPASQKIS
ncbi:MAG: ATP-dependent Clp protease ATP-binding subunit, partial [Leptospiraceae bacterium]|nr:ATP-dependent Clp protease ATP-binding subunit [Leptospiraceae bacterium]